MLPRILRLLAAATIVATGSACAGSTASPPVTAVAANGSVTAPVHKGPPATNALWVPPKGSTVAIQYGGKKLDTSVAASVYDVDGFDTTAATVAGLHAQRRHVVCYIDVGTWENWRSDADKFPSAVLGKPDGHWAGERWLDIRQTSILEPLMKARFQLCKSKGFDAVDPDNIDGYTNKTGFPLTAAEQLTYDTWVASAVHAIGLSVDQKNDPGQTKNFGTAFDFAVVEQCFQYDFCKTYAPYSAEDALVLDIEYSVSRQRFLDHTCPEAATLGQTALLKHLSLNAWVVTCPSS
jgi:hypothetical protein